MFSTFRNTTMAAIAGLGLLAVGIGPARANLITDPGFESCTARGQSPPPGWSGTAFCGQNPHSGTWSANFASNTLSQSIATTVGDTYDFSFWLFNNNVISGVGKFTASFGSDVVLNLSPGPFFPYTFEHFTVTAAAAPTTISFTTNASWFLDDVSVALAPVPEPTSLPLFALGLAGLGVVLRTRRG